jgi:hypothetical protein
MNTLIRWVGLTVSLLLVAVGAGISWWQHLGLHREILIAAARRWPSCWPPLIGIREIRSRPSDQAKRPGMVHSLRRGTPEWLICAQADHPTGTLAEDK